MKKGFGFLLFIIISFFSCNNCAVDKQFEKKYRKNIGLLKCAHSRKTYWVDKTKDAAMFLAIITQRELTDYYWEYASYKSDSGYYADMDYLDKWYKVNKCKMTIEKTDSLIKSHNEY